MGAMHLLAARDQELAPMGRSYGYAAIDRTP